MADSQPNPGGIQISPGSAPSDASSQALSEALGSSMVLVRVLLIALIAAFVFSCVFTVNPNEVAIVLRFGQPRGTGSEILLKQGLHWALPRPIDEIVRIPVGESRTIKATNGWYLEDPELVIAGRLPEAKGSLTPGVDGYVLTSDANILHVRTTLKYRVSDPAAYEFQFKNVTNLLSEILNNAVCRASAEYTAESALYREPNAFKDAIRARLDRALDRAGVKLTVEQLGVEVSAPIIVKNSFDEVPKEEQNLSTTKSKANAQRDEIIRTAEGEAKQIRDLGIIQSDTLLKTVSSTATNFLDQLPAYRRNPELFRERKRLETLTMVLTNSTDKFFIPQRADGQARELRVQLNREPALPPRTQPSR
jgi:membrane protease subunit HflK